MFIPFVCSKLFYNRLLRRFPPDSSHISYYNDADSSSLSQSDILRVHGARSLLIAHMLDDRAAGFKELDLHITVVKIQCVLCVFHSSLMLKLVSVSGEVDLSLV